ncbi:uncharacterized protein MELLADRAFT_89238 [Melampsora larici-populina 98AG31]|uniref:Uncharacterized protein n=1 Tax=Melampsora larici-populina (strain 98AG31 / pathotype 3-4-7) TaxID=747676 RepID=F4R5G4_MELLP|nr:uncharacterized protein MELLADRAFT_89238 [Melampsora larici-populina 98AG31]EGG12266.1 hypothetical protein MELLADRAFT_89238 [Melampsora larici-populina 98AG31]
MNTEMSYNFCGQFNGRGPVDLGERLNSPSQGGSLHGFNNHGLLRNNSNELHLQDSPGGRNDGGNNPCHLEFQRTPNHEANPGRLEYPNRRRERNDRSRSPSSRPIGTNTDPQWPSRGHPNLQDLRDLRESDLPNNTMSGDDIGDVVAMYSCPLSGPTMRSFQDMATRAGLEGPFHSYAKDQAEVFGKNNRHLAQVTANSKLLMEILRVNSKIDTMSDQLATMTRAVMALASPPEPGQAPAPGSATARASESAPAETTVRPKWCASPKLIGYTAVENGLEGYLPNSLFNIAKEGAAFAAEHLPRQTCGVEEAPDTQAYCTALRLAAKHAREKLHNVLLVGIYDPKTKDRVDIPVPHLKGMVQRVAVRCAVAGDKAEVDAVWAATDRPTRAQITYLRREAARVMLKGGRGSESVWAAVDRTLSELRLKANEDYTTAFYQIIYDEDCKYFDGKNWFKNLKAREPKVTLDLPSEEAIMARMSEAGRNPTPSGSHPTSIGNPPAI